MSHYFKGFDFTHLLSNDPSIRKSAEERYNSAKQHAHEFCEYLTREISVTSDEHRASVAFSVLKMLISEVKFSCEHLLALLDYYSNLFITSKSQTFIRSFSLFLETLLIQIDSSPNAQTPAKPLLSAPCYIHKESLLLDAKLTGINAKLLIAFLSMYLEHLIQRNISLKTLRKLSFQFIYKKTNSIKLEGSEAQKEELEKAKAQFYILLLTNTRKLCFNVFTEHFFTLPKQMCNYGIEMMKYKLVNAQKMNLMLNFFFKFIINVGAQTAAKFLKEQLETHLSFSKLLGQLITQINVVRFPVDSEIEAEVFEALSQHNSSSSSEEELNDNSSQTMVEEFSAQQIKIEDHKEQLYFWVLHVLLAHNSISQTEIFELADPLESLFHNFYFEDDGANDFMVWMMKGLSEGRRGELYYESYCYYLYYLQGHFFKESNLKEIKQQVALMALQDLKCFRFAKLKDMCSVLFYLRMFIGTWLASKEFHSAAISTIMSFFYRFNCQEFSEAILTCFTPDIRKFESNMKDEITNSLWPLIAVVNPQMKQHILRSLRERLEQENQIDSCFVSDLLAMINRNSTFFIDYYEKEQIFVKVEYLRLISLSIARIPNLVCNIIEIIAFLTQLVKSCTKSVLEVEQMLEIFAAIFHRQNKKVKICSIVPKLQIVNLLVEEFKTLARHIREHQSLLIEIASFPFSTLQLEETMAMHRLQALTLEYLLSLELDDRLCDVLEVFFTLNESAITEAVTACVLAKTINTPNYFRMVYLLSPRPYPVNLSINFKLTELKHYKWAALYIIGKFQPPSFKAISRAPRDQATELAQQLGAMQTQLSSEEFYSLMMMRSQLSVFSKDDENIWLSGITSAAVHNIFNQLYQEKYTRTSLEQTIKKLLKGFGYELE